MGFPSSKKSTWGSKGSPTPKKQGVYASPRGHTIVHDSEYMSALHKHDPLPIQVPGVVNVGPIELHHQPNPQPGGKRRDFDAGVVPLNRSAHAYVEFDANGPAAERALLPVFGEWSALHWFAFQEGLLDHPRKGQMFLQWVVDTYNAQNAQKAPQ